MAYIILVDNVRIAAAFGEPINLTIMDVAWGGAAEMIDSTDVRVADRCHDLVNCANCVHARYEPGYSDTQWEPGEPAYYYCELSDELEEAQGEVGEEYAKGCADFVAKTVTACEVCKRAVPVTVRAIPEELGAYCCSDACKERYIAEVIAGEDWDWDVPFPTLDIEFDEVM